MFQSINITSRTVFVCISHYTGTTEVFVQVMTGPTVPTGVGVTAVVDIWYRDSYTSGGT